MIKAHNILFELLKFGLLEESAKYYQGYSPDCNCRDYKCKIESCGNNAYSNGYCNAHYLRFRSGKDMYAPIKNRKCGTLCSVCGEPLNGKGGWNLCAKHYKQKRASIIRRIIIKYFGDSCSVCGVSYNDVCYDLHHKISHDKIGGVSTLINNSSIKNIADEAMKCELICANCHRILHHG